MSMQDLEDFFDDNIPDEILYDDSWQPRLLPTPDDLLQGMGSFEDLIEDE